MTTTDHTAHPESARGGAVSAFYEPSQGPSEAKAKTTSAAESY